jgi:hypothetical protein
MPSFLTLLAGAVACCAQPFVSTDPPWAAVLGRHSEVIARPVRTTVADSLASAAHGSLVKGTVVLRTGQPCAGASVCVVGAPRQLVITNAQGGFELPVPAGATVTVSIDYFGEGTSRVKVALPLTKPLQITLGQ